MGFIYLSVLYTLAQVFWILFFYLFFFSLKRFPKLYTFQDSKKPGSTLAGRDGWGGTGTVSVALRKSREHSGNRLMK